MVGYLDRPQQQPRHLEEPSLVRELVEEVFWGVLDRLEVVSFKPHNVSFKTLN